MILLTTSSGNCAGCGVLSGEALFVPDVTFFIDQTSPGFLPLGLTLSFPFLY